MLKITELAPVPPAEKGEYEYVAIVVTPSEVSLREWKGDEVTLLDSAEVESEKDVWYDLVIEWEEETLTVSRGLRGGEKEEILSAETTLESESTKVGFGLGAKADYLFDDVRFAAPSLSGGQSTMGRQYAYDAFGRRVAESYYIDGVTQTRYYVYDGDRVVEELDGDGNMTAGYVFGPYVDEVLAMRRDVDNNGTLETFYYLHDDQFNVIALTDAAGEVVERYEYGDFGDPTIYDASGVEREDKTSAFGNIYMFQGRPYYAETGLYFFRTRYLDPVQGRFISRDTIGVWGDPNNLGNPYTFVGNSPWTHTDPHGEAIETGWDAFNVGLGVVSLGSNLAEGNWGWAALDAVGVVADGLATAVPFIPGGAGTAIKATRVISAVDSGVNVAVSTAGAIEAAGSGDLKRTAMNAAGAALGAKGMGGAGAKAPDVPTGGKLHDPIKRSRSESSDELPKYWQKYYDEVGEGGDDLSDLLGLVRKRVVASEDVSSYYRPKTNTIGFAPNAKKWELYEEYLHSVVARDKKLFARNLQKAKDSIDATRRELGLKSFGSRNDVAEEIAVKSFMLRHAKGLKLDTPTQMLLSLQIDRLTKYGFTRNY